MGSWVTCRVVDARGLRRIWDMWAACVGEIDAHGGSQSGRFGKCPDEGKKREHDVLCMRKYTGEIQIHSHILARFG